MANAWTHRPAWTALSTVGIAGIAALAPSTEQLGEGGLALLLVAAIAALSVGVWVARVEATAPAVPASGAGVAAASVGEVWLTAAAAAAAAPVVAALGWFGIMLAALAWAVVAVANGSLRVLTGIVAVGVVALAIAGTLVAVTQGMPWTLLEPPQRIAFVETRHWLGLAVVLGVLLSGAGFGNWAGATDAHRRTPIAVAGLGVVVLVGLTVRRAVAYDAGMLAGFDALGTILAVMAAVAAILAVGWRRERARPLRGVVGLVATLLFVGPAQAALPLWWSVLLPLGMAVYLIARALELRRAAAIRSVVLAAVMITVAWLGWPGLPSPLAAAAVMALPVLALWVAGTRVLLVRPA